MSLPPCKVGIGGAKRRRAREANVKVRRITMMLAAAGLAAAPLASANAASPLSVARAAAPLSGASLLQGEESNHGGGSTAVILGVVLIVLIGIAAISGGGGPDSP